MEAEKNYEIRLECLKMAMELNPGLATSQLIIEEAERLYSFIVKS